MKFDVEFYMKGPHGSFQSFQTTQFEGADLHDALSDLRRRLPNGHGIETIGILVFSAEHDTELMKCAVATTND